MVPNKKAMLAYFMSFLMVVHRMLYLKNIALLL